MAATGIGSRDRVKENNCQVGQKIQIFPPTKQPSPLCCDLSQDFGAKQIGGRLEKSIELLRRRYERTPGCTLRLITSLSSCCHLPFSLNEDWANEAEVN